MDIYGVLEQVLERLHHRGRVTYQGLKAHFHLDDDLLALLKEELLFAHPVADEDGRGLVWTGPPAPSEPDPQHRAVAESRFQSLLRAVIALLQQERRLTYRTAGHVFDIDEALLEEIRDELTFRRLAVDEDGNGLVWMGEVPPVTLPLRVVSSLPVTVGSTAVTSPAVPPLPLRTTEADTPSHEPTAPRQELFPDTPNNTPSVTPEPSRTTPEAERAYR